MESCTLASDITVYRCLTLSGTMIETGHDRTKIRILKSAVRNVDVHAADAVLPNATAAESKKESK